jgi:hypothetical protein
MPRPNVLGATLVAVLSVAALPAAATPPGAAGATAFLRQVYSHYPLPDRPTGREYDPFHRDAPATFEPRLVAMLAEADRLTPDGSEGVLEADPICQCNSGATRGVVMPAVATLPGQAESIVVMHDPGSPRTSHRIRIQLMHTARGWRIYDIIDPGGSLRATVTDYVADHRRIHRG